MSHIFQFSLTLSAMNKQLMFCVNDDNCSFCFQCSFNVNTFLVAFLLQSFLDNLGGTVGAVVGPSVQNSCREAYNKLLLPGLNALTQQVFSQVNESFSRGTKECELSIYIFFFLSCGCMGHGPPFSSLTLSSFFFPIF